jgi:hypothetical protein
MISLEQLPKFPCHWSNKKPLTEHGFYDARIDVDDRSWPLAGVPGSAMSGFDFLDIDPRNGGHRWLAENEHRLPVTRVHHTRGGGWHYLFRYAGVRLRKEIASGVECKGDGGYVIWWPREGLKVEDHPIADWPDWLLELARRDGMGRGAPSQLTVNPEARARSLGNAVLKDPTRKCLHWAACRFSEMIEWGYPKDRAIKILNLVAPRGMDFADGLSIVERRINALARIVATAQEGDRNDTLYWVAIELFRLTPRAAAIATDAGAQCGLGREEVQRTIMSAFKRGRGTTHLRDET